MGKLVFVLMFLPVIPLRAECQHPYCDRSAAYDAITHDDGAYTAGPSTDVPESAADRLKEELAQVGVEKFTSSDYKPGLVRHIVLFRYNPTVTPAEKEEVKRRFLALQRLARRNGRPYLVSIEAGAQNSGEGADQRLEEGFIVTFRSQGDRNFYVGQPVVKDPQYYDPAHQAFKDFVGPLLAPNGALVFDFAAGR